MDGLFWLIPWNRLWIISIAYFIFLRTNETNNLKNEIWLWLWLFWWFLRIWNDIFKTNFTKWFQFEIIKTHLGSPSKSNSHHYCQRLEKGRKKWTYENTFLIKTKYSIFPENNNNNNKNEREEKIKGKKQLIVPVHKRTSTVTVYETILH